MPGPVIVYLEGGFSQFSTLPLDECQDTWLNSTVHKFYHKHKERQ